MNFSLELTKFIGAIKFKKQYSLNQPFT